MHFQQDQQVREGGVDDQDGLDGGFPDFLQVVDHLIVNLIVTRWSLNRWSQCAILSYSSSSLSSSPSGDH